MADVLILKRKHFAEDVQPLTWSDLKWMGRPRQGDIVSVQETGFYRIEALQSGLHGWDRDAFCLVRVTNASAGPLRYLTQSYDDGLPIQSTKRFKRRYRIAVWESLPWIKAPVEVNGKSFIEWYHIRANIGGVAIVDKAA